MRGGGCGQNNWRDGFQRGTPAQKWDVLDEAPLAPLWIPHKHECVPCSYMYTPEQHLSGNLQGKQQFGYFGN